MSGEGDAGAAEPYLFPRHAAEVDRLDVQHYALRQLLRGNFLAPVVDPDRVLDVGAGTGQWGFEVCAAFPSATVVGFDLVPGKPGAPPGYRYVPGNVLTGLPFPDGEFDFDHQRLLLTGVPLDAWPAVVRDLARVTRPGGWVELAEAPFGLRRGGASTAHMLEFMRTMAGARGLDTTSVVFDHLDLYLEDAGVVDVRRREVEVPVGHWGGEAGSLMLTDLRSAASRLFEVLQERSGFSGEEARKLISAAVSEWERERAVLPCATAYGRKPTATR
jgi:SAM-dependent methyltransferase